MKSYAALLVLYFFGQSFSQTLDLGKVVDASDIFQPFTTYGYAPSSLYEDGVYHLFFCATGEYVPAPHINNNTFTPDSGMVWDYIRYTTSRNGRDWTPSRIILKPNLTFDSTSINEHCACDPSIVKAPDGYYYLFYGGALDGGNTSIFVSRSTNIGGPYQKLRTNNTWAVDPRDPKVIRLPSNPSVRHAECVTAGTLNTLGNCPAGPFNYGAGLPTVVYHGGEFHMWYLDRSAVPSQTYYTHATTVAGTWSIPESTGVDLDGEIKYNNTTSAFEMYRAIYGHHSDQIYPFVRPEHRKMSSTDGVHWTDLGVSIPMINDTHNMGVISKRSDGVINSGDGYIVVSGGPKNANDNEPQYGNIWDSTLAEFKPGTKWANWDILGKAVGYTDSLTYSIPSGWLWNGALIGNQMISGADYDGDGLTDRASVKTSNGHWFVRGSKTDTSIADIPWDSDLGIPYQSGWETVVGDFDGDGKMDPGMVDVANGTWYVLSSKNSYGQGIPSIMPWGGVWAGMNSQNQVVQGGDYDGDGKTDFVIINKTNGHWYGISSATGVPGGITGMPWDSTLGIPYQPGWQVAVGDFDGDGKTDPAMVDVANGNWYVLSSKNGYAQGLPAPFTWGWNWIGMSSLHQLALADYDGDGLTDPAIIKKSNGTWYILSSRESLRAANAVVFSNVPWGTNPFGGYSSSTWDLVIGDFDGGARADVVMVDRLNHRWYIRGSRNPNTTGITNTTFNLP